MICEFISTNSMFSSKVLALGKKNSSTLGFMPEGGFIEHLKKRWVAIAIDEDILLGYVLFRISKKTNILSVTHLCVDENHRGKNIAQFLLNNIKHKYQNDLSGISLRCREDYTGPTYLWKKYGFIAKDKIRSRSFEENYLIKWWYGFNQIDLFSFSQEEKKHQVLLDMNILIKLRDNTDKYILSLLDDRFLDEVEYYFAHESYNEILRDTNSDRARQTRAFVQKHFSEARASYDESNQIYKELKPLFKEKKDNDSSDIKQLSNCVAAGISYFLTLDKEILNKRETIENIHQIQILTPEEFLLTIDQFIDDTGYYPTRLAGAEHTTNKINASNLNYYLDVFLQKNKNEQKAAFKRNVQSVMEDLKNSGIQTVEDNNSTPLAFWGYCLTEYSFQVKFIRIKAKILEITLFTQLLYEIINLAITKGKHEIEIIEDYFDLEKMELLKKFGFINKNNIWKKIAIKSLINSQELLSKFPFLEDFLDENDLLVLKNENMSNKTFFLYQIERKLYPLKFKDLEIPCYIIPIRRYWAGQLFDKYNSDSDFFGANPQKIWNRENIYYRSVKPVTEEGPARILWYVSQQNKHSRQKSILATSYLEDIYIDTAKNQFKNFRKYGVYEWKHLYELAGEDENSIIKAIKFSDTEVFKTEINLEKITRILERHERKKNTFASPLEVNSRIFNDFYELTMNQNV